jgi:acyl carrier protein
MLNAIEAVTKIKGILHEQFDIDPTTLDESTKLTDLGIDSLHLVDVMLEIETELNITITDLSFSPEATLGELGSIVSKCVIDAQNG